MLASCGGLLSLASASAPPPLPPPPTGWPHRDAATGATKHAAVGLVAAGGVPAGLGSVIGAAAKHAGGALFDQDQPWEQRIDNGYPNVVHAPGDPGGDWKLWYGTCFEPHNCAKQLLLFANSSDGIAWTKPHLGRYDLAAVFPALAKLGKANNIVMYGGGLGVYRDEHEPDAAKRFKISGGSPAGCFSDDGASDCVVGVAASPDGIGDWTGVSALGWPSPWRPDCHTNLFFDGDLGRYLMTTRDYTQGGSGRDIGIAASAAREGNWTEVYDNEFPPAKEIGGCAKVADAGGGYYDECGAKCLATAGCEFFWAYGSGKSAGNCCLKSAVEPGALVKPACTTCDGKWFAMEGRVRPTPGFAWAEAPTLVEQGTADRQLYSQITWKWYDVYLGLVMVFDASTGSVGPTAGQVHCRLAWSANATDPQGWRWADAAGGLAGKDFIALGAPGDFDSHVCFAAHSPVRLPDGTARVYYMGGNGPHTGLRNESFGLATVAPDRFAGLGGAGGQLTTRTVLVTGAELTLTLDVAAAAGSSVTVGVVGQGAALAASVPLTSSGTDARVTFAAAPSHPLAALVGQEVALTLDVKGGATVFTVGFAP
jgi:hypothetical protein